MPAGELHLQLAVNFPDNRKVRKLNRFGREVRPLRDLYVQMCLHSKGNRTDGFVGDEQIGLLVYPDSEKNGMRDAARLPRVRSSRPALSSMTTKVNRTITAPE